MLILDQLTIPKFQSAIDIDSKGTLTKKSFLKEAYIEVSNKEIDFNQFDERCKWFAGKLIDDISKMNLLDIKQVCPYIELSDKLSYRGREVEFNTKSAILVYLSIYTSMKNVYRNIVDDIKSNLIDKYSNEINKELMRLAMLNRDVYQLDTSILIPFLSRINQNGNKFLNIISSLVLMLLLDSNYCKINSILLLLIARSTRSILHASRKYIYVFINGTGNLFNYDLSLLSEDIYNQISVSISP